MGPTALAQQNMHEFVRLEGPLKLFQTAVSVDASAFDHLKRMGSAGAEMDKIGDLAIHEAMWNLALVCVDRTSSEGMSCMVLVRVRWVD